MTVDSAVATLAAGLVCGFLAVVLSLSLGNLLFFGEMREFVPIALGMALFATVVLAAIAALTSPILGAVSIAQEVPIVAIAGPAAAITAALSGTTPPAEIAITIVVAAGLSTLVTGAILVLLGCFRLGRLIRYVPFPVIGGFLAGTGWLILLGGLGVIAGDAIGPDSVHVLLQPVVALKVAIGVGFAVLVAIVQLRIGGALILPLALFLAMVAYNVIVAAFGIPHATLSAAGWIVQLQGESLWPPIQPSDLAVIDWDAMLASGVMLPGIVVVTVLALLMNATGIELASGHDVDLDRELRSVGIQNIAAGVGGGVPGYPAVSLSVLAMRLGAGNRLTGLVVSAVTAAVLFFGGTILDLVPTPLLGSLLVWIGAALVFEWLVRTARRVSPWEYLIILLIFLVIIGAGFTAGVLVGLVAAIVLFVVEYGRVDSVRHVLSGREYQSTYEISEERRARLVELGSAIVIVRLQGFIFFGTADRLRKRIESHLSESVLFLIVDFRRVTRVDSSAAVSFVRLGQSASRHGFTMVLTGMAPAVERSLTRGGLGARSYIRFEPDIDHGLMWSENRLLDRFSPSLDIDRELDLAEIALGVSDPELAASLSDFFEPVTLVPGELLVEAGTPSEEMYFVASGRGAVTIPDRSGAASVHVATIGPGAIVGELAFYLRQPRNASIVVKEPMTAWRFSRTNLHRLEAQMPELANRFHERLAAMLAARLTRTNRLVSFLAD